MIDIKIAIVIPARFGSTRFPGKPLAMIAGKTMIQRVIDIAKIASRDKNNVRVLVATDNQDVEEIAKAAYVDVMITEDANTGSDRVLQAIRKAKYEVDYVINLQGDAPLTPPEIITKMIEQCEMNNSLEVITPVVRLTWEELDALREFKAKAGSGGTTVVQNSDGYAIWFSKSIIPVIRKEDRSKKYSPILRHIGIYGFNIKVLEKFVSWPRSYYEELEELEQLRILENNYKIKLLDITQVRYPLSSGIDTKEDLILAEKILKEFGEFV